MVTGKNGNIGTTQVSTIHPSIASRLSSITFVDGKVNSFDSYLDDSPWKKGLRNDSTIQAGYFRTPEGNFVWGVPANGMVRLNNGRLMPARGNQLLQEP